MPNTNSQNKSLSNNTIVSAHQTDFCPSRLNNRNNNAKIAPIKIIKQKSTDTEMDYKDSDDNEFNWQIVNSPKNPKRQNSSPGQSPKPKMPNNLKDLNVFSSPNRYNSLYIDTNETNKTTDNTEMNIDIENENIIVKPPPPIFIKSNIKNYQIFCDQLRSLQTPPLDFSCKTTTNSLKLNTSNSNAYRMVIKYLKEKKVSFYTYQPHDEKPYRIVLRNLHPTTSIDFIKEDLEKNGFLVRNITNVLQYQTKSPLPLFFVDLEPAINNKDIFELKFLCYTKIKIETPKIKKQIPQCMNCQDYGHTRSYCHNIPRCVRCGDDHSSVTCPKSKDLPAKCALCFGDHPANYRGCPALKNIQINQNRHSIQGNKNHLNNNNTRYGNNKTVQTHPSPNGTSENKNMPTLKYTYAQATNNQNQNSKIQTQIDSSSLLTAQLTSFIDELKSLITPLISLLTKVIDKVLDKK